MVLKLAFDFMSGNHNFMKDFSKSRAALKSITEHFAILLQNATQVYYKMRQVFYYKMRQFLQNATFITTCDSAKSNTVI